MGGRDVCQEGFRFRERGGKMNGEDGTKRELMDRLGEMRKLLAKIRISAPGSRPSREDLKETQEGYWRLVKTAETAAGVVEERDPLKKGHQFRVANLACATGREMNLSSARLEGLRIGGLLHDIGKVSIPTELLLKPTRLTGAEQQLLITHVRSGVEILQDIPFPWPVARMVLEHHERLDGSGYPDGIRGESLMLESRILAVADVVDAIASPRSYRPARGIEVALYDIKGFRGIRYDPDVVDACLHLFEEKEYRLPMDYD